MLPPEALRSNPQYAPSLVDILFFVVARPGDGERRRCESVWEAPGGSFFVSFPDDPYPLN